MKPAFKISSHEFGYGRIARAFKNSQLIRPLPDDAIIICETAH
jgi:hypothetical protein